MEEEKKKMPLVGGLSDVCEADEHVQKLVEGLKEQLKSHLGTQQLKELKVVCYKKQVVAGTNYYVKVIIINNAYHKQTNLKIKILK